MIKVIKRIHEVKAINELDIMSGKAFKRLAKIAKSYGNNVDDAELSLFCIEGTWIVRAVWYD